MHWVLNVYVNSNKHWDVFKCTLMILYDEFNIKTCCGPPLNSLSVCMLILIYSMCHFVFLKSIKYQNMVIFDIRFMPDCTSVTMAYDHLCIKSTVDDNTGHEHK